MIPRIFLPFSLLILLCMVCGRSPVSLDADFSSRPQWTYVMRVDIDGTRRIQDFTERFSNSARCLLDGTPIPDSASFLSVAIHNVSIVSTVLGEAMTENMKRQFEGMRVNYSAADGDLLPVDTTTFPQIDIGGWNIFRTLSRTIPSLPRGKIRPGYCWEREKTAPISTSVGTAVGTLYQSFSFDSIRQDPQQEPYAYLSWKFTYRIATDRRDSAAIPEEIPQIGSGTGMAIFNINGKYLRKASLEFATAPVRDSTRTMAWTEKVGLELRD